MTDNRKHQLQKLYVELTQRIGYNRQRAAYYFALEPDGGEDEEWAAEHLDRVDRLLKTRGRVVSRLSSYGEAVV